MPEYEAAENTSAGNSTSGMTGELLARLSHDIRTSMNGVAGMLALLLDSDLTAAQQHLASNAWDCADDLMALIECIIDFSTIEANRFVLAQASFDLLATTQAACARPLATARDKGRILQVQLPAALSLRGDAARLRQIIESLLNCALALAPQGSITADITAESLDTGECRLRVELNLPALDAAGKHLAALLNQADRLDMSRLSQHGRTGLELALCARLSKLMGAQIAIADTPEEGSRIWFSVALEHAPHAQGAPRIALLEPYEADRDTLAHWLAAEGMRVDAFDTVTAALAAIGKAEAEHDPYRIAMLGSQVQGMDCEILGAAIKADAAYRDILLVALAEQSRLENAGSLARAGFSALIKKPLQQQETLAVLSTLCASVSQANVPSFIASGEAPLSSKQPHTFAGKRILIVDDNPINRQVAQRMVEKFGCRPEVAGDGKQAVGLHAAHPYDLILMDCQMPQMDGYEATQRIRELDGDARRTPIVALTACATQGEREKCLATGMDDFISKPVRPQILEEVLGRWLANATPCEIAEAAGCGDELEMVRDMFGSDFAELASLYRNDSPPRLAALRRACADGDYLQVVKVAHAFSGSSVSIGATGLSALCKELELRAKANSLDDFRERLGAIEAEYNRISDKLQAMVQPNLEAA